MKVDETHLVRPRLRRNIKLEIRQVRYTGALCGSLLGLAVVKLTATGLKIFVILSLPGMLTVYFLGGTGAAPSLSVGIVNLLVYASVGALLGDVGARLLKRRPRVGCCSECDYDLTGNVSGICPECGTPLRASREGR